MKINIVIIIGLLLAFCFNLSFSENDENYNEDAYNEEDNYYEEDEGQPNSVSSTVEKSNTKLPTSIIQSTFMTPTTTSLGSTSSNYLNTLRHFDEDCPIECTCYDSTFFVDCSARNLTSVPNNLPNNMHKLNISSNLIVKLTPSSFQNARNLTELDLSENEIVTIDPLTFQNMKRLKHINLSNNNLTKLDPQTFSYATSLRSLNLGYNPLVLENDSADRLNGFIFHHHLEELILDGCNLDNIPHYTFNNLTSLLRLSLADNPLSEYIGASNFEPLKDLIFLRIPDLAQVTVNDFCQVLEANDRIEMPSFSISCFELIATGNFDESILRTTTTTEEPTTTTKKTTTITSTSTIRTTSTQEIAAPITPEPMIVTPKVEQSTTQIQFKNASLNGTIGKLAEPAKGNVLDVPQDTIKMMLIGIIIIAVGGLLIGFICRMDILGIKSRMCRSNKRRPPPTDQVSPVEEIPLNKVNNNRNSNGTANNNPNPTAGTAMLGTGEV